METKTIKDLAILGGQKAIGAKGEHYQWPVISRETENAVLKQLRRTISIYDKSGVIDEVENRIAKYYGVKYALLTNSGTTAIYSMYASAGLKAGDEVIVPAYNFFASAVPMFLVGAVPVLCESDPKTGNIDIKSAEQKITSRTKAIEVTHMWGMPADAEALAKLAKERKLLLFEDFSHAHGAEISDKKVGTFGDVSAASLQAQKILNGGEGGVLLTNNEEIYYKAILLGHYNKRALQEIPESHPLRKYAMSGTGLKLRIHPLAAAIVNQQFDHLDDWLRQKRQFASYLGKRLGSIPGIEVPKFDARKSPSWYAYLFHYNGEELGNLPISRFYEALKAEGGKEFDRPNSTCPLNYLPLFQDPTAVYPDYKISYKKGDFPAAESFHETSIKMPVWALRK
ncbi:MAG: DegT/DnrJ/EryC1/StrS family aminotransferase, partial [Rhabdochlamydiaceae bacterium]